MRCTKPRQPALNENFNLPYGSHVKKHDTRLLIGRIAFLTCGKSDTRHLIGLHRFANENLLCGFSVCKSQYVYNKGRFNPEVVGSIPTEVKKIFSSPRVVPWFPLLGLSSSGLFMGKISTLIYTSELILCFTIYFSNPVKFQHLGCNISWHWTIYRSLYDWGRVCIKSLEQRRRI